MTRTATWKAFALAAALTGARMFGAATATAEPKTSGSNSSTSRSSDSVRDCRQGRLRHLDSEVRRGLTGHYYSSPAIRTSA